MRLTSYGQELIGSEKAPISKKNLIAAAKAVGLKISFDRLGRAIQKRTRGMNPGYAPIEDSDGNYIIAE